MLKRILELTQPSTSASFIQTHSIPFAAIGMNTQSSPIMRAILISQATSKIKAKARRPVTITRIVL